MNQVPQLRCRVVRFSNRQNHGVHLHNWRPRADTLNSLARLLPKTQVSDAAVQEMSDLNQAVGSLRLMRLKLFSTLA